jgi:hypothetical protein
MSTYTPGPWVAQGNLVMKDVIAICDTAVNVTYYDEWEANARLIAAAPDLLEALRDIAGLNDEDGNSRICEDDDACRDRALMAITKATGGAK